MPELRVLFHELVVGRIHKDVERHIRAVRVELIRRHLTYLEPAEKHGRPDVERSQVVAFQHELSSGNTRCKNRGYFETYEIASGLVGCADIHANIRTG